MNSFPKNSEFFVGSEVIKENQSGIYKITCLPTGRSYIGMAKNLRHRIRGHKEHLLKGTHYNFLLQRAYNKYGLGCFSVTILPTIPNKSLREQEAHYIILYDTTNPKKGYNLQEVEATGKLIFTERQAIAIKNRTRSFSAYNEYLKNEEIYEFAKINDHLTGPEIARMFNVHTDRVYWVLSGFNHYPRLKVGFYQTRLRATYFPKIIAYFCAGDSCNTISKKVPFCFNRVNNILRKAGYDPSGQPKKQVLNLLTGVYETKEQAAKSVGFSVSYFDRLMKYNKICYI